MITLESLVGSVPFYEAAPQKILRKHGKSGVNPLSSAYNFKTEETKSVTKIVVQKAEHVVETDSSGIHIRIKKRKAEEGVKVLVKKVEEEGVHAELDENEITFAKKAIQKLLKHDYGYPFAVPVNPVELEIPDYFNIIKKPMDLGTVQKNLSRNRYKSMEEFVDDVTLVFSNAMTYNPPGHDVHVMADTLNKLFQAEYDEYSKKRKQKKEKKKKKAQDSQSVNVIVHNEDPQTTQVH